MEAILLEKQLVNIGLNNFTCGNKVKQKTGTPILHCSSLVIGQDFLSLHVKLQSLITHHGNSVKVKATRRRRVFEKSETYVLMEPGEEEKFVSEEELKLKLKGYLENWPTKTLPPDLARAMLPISSSEISLVSSRAFGVAPCSIVEPSSDATHFESLFCFLAKSRFKLPSASRAAATRSYSKGLAYLKELSARASLHNHAMTNKWSMQTISQRNDSILGFPLTRKFSVQTQRRIPLT